MKILLTIFLASAIWSSCAINRLADKIEESHNSLHRQKALFITDTIQVKDFIYYTFENPAGTKKYYLKTWKVLPDTLIHNYRNDTYFWSIKFKPYNCQKIKNLGRY